MGIRGCFIGVSVDDEGAKIERFIVIEILNKHTENISSLALVLETKWMV